MEGRSVSRMTKRENVIEGLEGIIDDCFDIYRSNADSYKCEKAKEYSDVAIDAISLLKEQEKIKKQFIEAFNTIRDAYNIPANREKILLNYLLRNACCCADREWKEGR